MNSLKKQEIMFKRLQAMNILTKEYILNEIAIKNKRIYEIEMEIEHFKLSKSIQIRYIEQFKSAATPSQIQKIVARINIPTLQINMAGLSDSLYEMIDEIKIDIDNYHSILLKI
jgi:hypothetical protein